MPTQIKLETEKYWNEKLAVQKARSRRASNHKALQDFTTFLVGLGVIGLVVFLLPAFIPSIQHQIHEFDWRAMLGGLVDQSGFLTL